jgi:hypothetical protein
MTPTELIEELRSAGHEPLGPVSAWPQERHLALMEQMRVAAHTPVQHEARVKASFGQMATGLVRAAAQAVTNGRVPESIREERMATCRACPFFVEESQRCSECGCFMEAKTWIGGDPNQLCPQQKWSR